MCGHTLLKISIKRYAGRQHFSYRMFVKLELFLVYILFLLWKNNLNSPFVMDYGLPMFSLKCIRAIILNMMITHTKVHT